MGKRERKRAHCPLNLWTFQASVSCVSNVCVFPARVMLSVLGTAVFLVCVVTVQASVLWALYPDTCGLGGLCYHRVICLGHVLCLNFLLIIFAAFLRVCLYIFSVILT